MRLLSWRWSGVAWCGAAVLLTVSNAQAQRAKARAAEPTVPRALALALLAGWGSDSAADLLVGEPAPAVAATLKLPPGARYLGAMITQWIQTTVIASREPADAVLATLRSELEVQGWQPTPGTPTGGFQERVPEENLHLCKDGAGLVLGRQPAQQGAQTVYVLSGEAARDRCGTENVRVSGSITGALAPTLTHPAGAHSDRQRCMSRHLASMSGGPNDAVVTSLSARALLDAYGRELDSLGWHRAPEEGPGSLVGDVWQRTDSSNARTRIHLEVEVSDSLADCRTVRMSIERSYP